jgi:hypothetical protein
MNSRINATLFGLHKPWARITLTLFVSMFLVFSLTQASLGQTETEKILGVDFIEGKGEGQDFEGIALGNKDIRETAATIINVALSLLGIIAVVVVLIGGFYWMTAGGNEDQIGKAKGWIFSGIIGLAIILSAFAISKFVLEKLGEATALEGFEG